MPSPTILSRSELTAATTRFKALYEQHWVSTELPDYSPLVLDVPTTATKETYEYLKDIPGMRQWIGERQLREVVAASNDVESVEYEVTMNCSVRDIQSDQLGLYDRKIRQMAPAAKRHPVELLCTLLDAANSTACFDGQYLVDDDHSVAGSSVSNKGTAALTYDTVVTNDIAMRNFSDDEGRNLGIAATHLVVPNALHYTAMDILKAAQKSGSADSHFNALKGLTQITLPELSDANNWFLIDASKPIKPVIWQHRVLPDALEMDDGDQFMKHVVYYGVYGDYKMAAYDWRCIFGAIV